MNKYKRQTETDIVEDGLHKSDRNLSLLDKIVFCILDIQSCMLLLTGSGILQADDFRQYSWNKGTCGLTDTCFAASSSNLLTRTAWRAFMATLMDVERVVCHG